MPRALLGAALLVCTCAPRTPGPPQTARSLEQELNIGPTLTPPTPVPGALFGHALAVLRDSSGYSHLVVGAPQADGGAVYVFNRFVDKTTAPAAQILSSPKPGAAFGSALLVTDLNLDGIDDLIVGAPAATEAATTNEGLVFVFHGLPDGGFGPYSNLNPATPIANARLGTALAKVPSGGAAPFIAVLAPGVSAVEIFDAVGTQIANVPSPGIDAGTSLAVLDFNGDLKPDLLVGMPARQQILPLYGDGGSFTPRPIPTVIGPLGFGTAMIALGDVTGDGRDDLIVTAPDQPFGSSASGTGLFESGAALFTGMGVSMLLSTPPSVLHFGEAVADIGAFEGPDRKVVFGAPFAGMGGGIYFYSLQPLPAQAPLFIGSFAPGTANASFGNAIVGNVDFDNDGQLDLAVGGETFSGTGGVQIIFGRKGLPACSPSCGQCSLCEAMQCVPLALGAACTQPDPCVVSEGCDGDGGCLWRPACLNGLCDPGRDAGCYAPTDFHIVGDAVLTAVVNQPYPYNASGHVTISPPGAPASFDVCNGGPSFNVDANTGAVTWMPQTTGPTPLCIFARSLLDGGTDQYSFIVNVLPDFSLLPSQGMAPLSVMVQAPTTGATGFSWDFGDMSPLVQQHSGAQHTYLLPGSYWIELTMTDTSGQQVKLRKSVSVQDAAGDVPPVAVLARTAPTDFACPTCTGKLSYLWLFDDMTSSTQATVSRAFPAGTKHRVRLVVTDDKGLSGYDSMMVDSPGGAGMASPPDCRVSVDPPAGNAPLSGVSFSLTPPIIPPMMSKQNFPGTSFTDGGLYFGYGDVLDATGVTGCYDFAWVTVADEFGTPVDITSAPPLTVACGAKYTYAWTATGARPFTAQLQGPLGALLVGNSVTWIAPSQPGSYDFELVVQNPVRPAVQDFTVTVDCALPDGGAPPSDAGVPQPDLVDYSTCGCHASAGLPLLGLAALLRRRRLSRR